MNRTIEQRKSEQNYLFRLNFFDPDDPDLKKKVTSRLDSLTKGDRASTFKLTKEDVANITKVLKDKEEFKNELDYLRIYIKEILPDINKLIHSTIIRYDEVDSVRLEQLIKDKKLGLYKHYIINEVKRLNKYVDYEDLFKLNSYKNIDTIINLNDLIYDDRNNKVLVNAINPSSLKDSDYDIYYFYSHNFNNVPSKVFTNKDSLATLRTRHQEVVKHFSAFDHGDKNKDLDITRVISKEANNILTKEDLFKDYNKISKLTHYSRKIKSAHIFNKEQFFAFIKDAQQNSKDKVFAEYFIKFLYDKHNIEVAMKENTQDYDLCPTCKKLYNAKDHKDNCPSCGVDFNVVCLVCGNKHKNVICNRCDLSNDDYQKYEILIRDINLATARADYKNAKYLLDNFDNQIIRKLSKYNKNTEYKAVLNDINLYSSIETLENMFNKNFNAINVNNAINLFKRNYLKFIKQDPILEKRVANIDEQYEKYKEAIVCPTCGTVNFDKNSNTCINANCNMLFSHTCWNCNRPNDYLKNISCSCGATKAVTDKMQKDILSLENGLLNVSKNTYSPSSLKTELEAFITNYQTYNKPNTKLYDKVITLKKEAGQIIVSSEIATINKMFDSSNFNTGNIATLINKFKVDNIELIRSDASIKETVNNLDLKYDKYKNSQVCPSCSTRVFDIHAKACPNPSCKTIFVDVCWNCHKENNLLLNTKCLCGATQTLTNKMKVDLESFEKNLNNAKSGFYSNDLLKSDLSLLRKEYENYNKAGSTINQKLNSYLLQINNMVEAESLIEKEVNRLINKIKSLYQDKKLIELSSVLQQLKANYPKYSKDKDLELIEFSYQNLQNDLRKLKQFHSNNNETEVVVLANKIKTICSDCKEVDDILGSLVILPPSNVKFEVLDDQVVISYDKSNSFDTKYVILKNANNEPKDIDDAKVSFNNDINLEFKHRPIAAVTYYYKVYAVRNGIYSKGISSEGITLYPNINPSTINQEVSSDVISVSFEAPLNANKVVITKSLVGSEDETKIEVINLSSFVDKDVTLGNEYIYKFITVYSHNGKLIESTPYTHVFKPTVIPKTPIINSFDRLENNRFEIHYNNHEIESPVFYVSKNNINVSSNKIFSNIDFANFIKTNELDVLTYEKKANSIIFSVLPEHAVYILVATTLHGFTKVSNVVLINNSLGLKDLKTLVIGSKVYIQFDFVNNANKAYITYNPFEYHTEFKTSHNYIEVFNNNKRVNQPLDLGNNEQMYITVYTEQMKKDEAIISEGSKVLVENLSTRPIVYFTNLNQKGNKLSLLFKNDQLKELSNLKIKLYNNKTLLKEIEVSSLKLKLVKKMDEYQIKYQVKDDEVSNCNNIVITFEYSGHELNLIEMRN